MNPLLSPSKASNLFPKKLQQINKTNFVFSCKNLFLKVASPSLHGASEVNTAQSNTVMS